MGIFHHEVNLTEDTIRQEKALCFVCDNKKDPDPEEPPKKKPRKTKEKEKDKNQKPKDPAKKAVETNSLLHPTCFSRLVHVGQTTQQTV